MPKLWKLEPIHDESIIVMEADNGYPFTLVHIDTFYSDIDDRIWERLNEGKSVTVEVDFRIVEDSHE